MTDEMEYVEFFPAEPLPQCAHVGGHSLDDHPAVRLRLGQRTSEHAPLPVDIQPGPAAGIGDQHEQSKRAVYTQRVGWVGQVQVAYQGGVPRLRHEAIEAA